LVLLMVLQPLLDRFVSHPELKSLGCVRVGRPLQIEIREWNRARHGLRSAFFARNEVELIVDTPEVGDGIGGPVFEDKLRATGGYAGKEKVGWREGDDRLRGHRIWRGEILNEIAKGIEVVVPKAVMVPMKDSRMPSKARPDPMLPLRKGRVTRNQQPKKRETNHPPHASPPSEHYGCALLQATCDANNKEEWSRRAPGDMDGQARDGSG
jgi:hypothetical protein